MQTNRSEGARPDTALRGVACRKPSGTPLAESVERAQLGSRSLPNARLRVARTSADLFLFADSRNLGQALPWARPQVDFCGFAALTSIDGTDLAALDPPPHRNHNGEHAVLVVRHGDKNVVLVVDHLLGTSDIILKPLEGVPADVIGFAGTAVMGDGNLPTMLQVPLVFASRIVAAPADPVLGSIPVVMLSALAGQQNIEAGVQAGARTCLVKPFNLLALIHLIQRRVKESEVDFTSAPP